MSLLGFPLEGMRREIWVNEFKSFTDSQNKTRAFV